MSLSNRKYILRLTALVLSTVLLSGCGQSEAPTETTIPTTTVAETTAATESPEEIAYREAKTLFAQEDWEGAAAAFEALGDYSDSADRAAEARSHIVTVLYSEKFWWWEENMQPDGGGEIHDFTLQELSNGKIRFVIDYTMPEGREIVYFNPPNGDVTFENAGITTAERSICSFEIERAILEANPEITVNFYFYDGETEAAYYCGVYPEDMAKFISTEHIPQDPNAQVLRSEEMEFGVNGKGKEKTINSFTLQELSDGYIRYVIDCTMPKGVHITAFNPPNGDTVSKYMGTTEGGQGVYTVDIEKSLLEANPEITINFWDEASGPFFTGIDKKDVEKFISAG